MTKVHTDNPAVDLDVEVSTQDRWRTIAARAPGDHIAEIVTAIHRESTAHVDRMVRRILESVTGYERTGTVERDDLWRSVHRNLEVVLLAMAEQRSPTEPELAVRRELGRRRAQQGMPAEDIMRAFRIGYGVLWEILTEIVHGFGPAHARALLDQAARVWMTFDDVTSAVAEAHAEVVARQHLDRRRRALGLLNGIQRLPEGSQETEELCRSLDLDLHAAFTVAVQDCNDLATPDRHRTVTIEQPNRTVVIVSSNGSSPQIERTLADILNDAGGRHVGIGVTRHGLHGAQQSLRDAECAHHAARACDFATVHFRDHWLACLALQDRDQLDALVAPAVQALEHDATLLDTLRRYLANSGNLSAAGKELRIHANTVGYRLRQFARGTGIDARTPSGMALVQVALTYSGSPAGDTARRAGSRPDGGGNAWNTHGRLA